MKKEMSQGSKVKQPDSLASGTNAAQKLESGMSTVKIATKYQLGSSTSQNQLKQDSSHKDISPESKPEDQRSQQQVRLSAQVFART